MTASSMASFNMGVYYVLAALNDLKPFYRWTVPFRVVTFTVFTTAALTGIAPKPFIGVGVWELAGAIATGIALAKDARK
jgi:Flp pilus assembly protein protease CpaA